RLHVEVEDGQLLTVGGDVVLESAAHLRELGAFLAELVPAIQQETTAAGRGENRQRQPTAARRTGPAAGSALVGGDLVEAADDVADDLPDVAGRHRGLLSRGHDGRAIQQKRVGLPGQVGEDGDVRGVVADRVGDGAEPVLVDCGGAGEDSDVDRGGRAVENPARLV